MALTHEQMIEVAVRAARAACGPTVLHTPSSRGIAVLLPITQWLTIGLHYDPARDLWGVACALLLEDSGSLRHLLPAPVIGVPTDELDAAVVAFVDELVRLAAAVPLQIEVLGAHVAAVHLLAARKKPGALGALCRAFGTGGSLNGTGTHAIRDGARVAEGPEQTWGDGAVFRAHVASEGERGFTCNAPGATADEALMRALCGLLEDVPDDQRALAAKQELEKHIGIQY